MLAREDTKEFVGEPVADRLDSGEVEFDATELPEPICDTSAVSMVTPGSTAPPEYHPIGPGHGRVSRTPVRYAMASAFPGYPMSRRYVVR